jgi:hypothetical protein
VQSSIASPVISTSQQPACEQFSASDEDGPIWISNSNQTVPPKRTKKNSKTNMLNDDSEQAGASTSSNQSYSRMGTASTSQNTIATTDLVNNEVELLPPANGNTKRKNNKKKKQTRNQHSETNSTDHMHTRTTDSINEVDATREVRQPRTLVSTAVQTTHSRTTSKERMKSSNTPVTQSDHDYRPNTSTYPSHSTSTSGATQTNNASTSTSTSSSRIYGYGYKSSIHHRGNNANVNGYGMASTSPDVATPSSTFPNMTVMETRNTTTTTASSPIRTRGFTQSSNSSNYGRINVILPQTLCITMNLVLLIEIEILIVILQIIVVPMLFVIIVIVI